MDDQDKKVLKRFGDRVGYTAADLEQFSDGDFRVRHMRRLAEAYLWRFAGRQHSTDGIFGEEKYGTGYSQAGVLGIFASYDHAVSKVVIMRSLPWIISNQNKDGSWGDEPNKDVSTLAVISALRTTGFG